MATGKGMRKVIRILLALIRKRHRERNTMLISYIWRGRNFALYNIKTARKSQGKDDQLY